MAKKKKITNAEKLRVLGNGYDGGLVIKSQLLPHGEFPGKHINDVKIWYNNGDTHQIVIGTTGSGKTQCYVIPSILSIADSEGSMVINDPKGELAIKLSHYLKTMGYKVFVMNYFAPEAGTCFNQLFQIDQEYTKGLPHYFATRAISSLIKTIDVVTSGGEINDLEFFQKVEFQGNIPANLQKDVQVKGRYVIQSAGTVNARAQACVIQPAPEVNKENLASLTKMDAETLLSFLHELYALAYDSIQDLYNTRKDASVKEQSYNNEYLRVRQEKTVQAVTDVLDIINIENIKSYYENKIAINNAILETIPDTGLKSYVDTMHVTEILKEDAKELENDGLTVSVIKAFLLNLRADHAAIWSQCEGRATSAAGAIANIVGGTNGKDDKFWDLTAKSLISAGILLACRESYEDHTKHLGSVYQILTNLSVNVGNDKNPKTGLDLIADRLLEGDTVKNEFSSFYNAADRTKASIDVSAIAAIDVFKYRDVCSQAAFHEFEPRFLFEDKTAVFLITPGSDNTGTAAKTILSTLFIEEMYDALDDYAKKTLEGRLPRPVYFLLDEIANIPPIPELGSKISLARSKNMRFSLILQSLDQLKKKYQNSAEEIKENTELLYLLSNNIGTAKEISERIGKQTIEITSYSRSSKGSSDSENTNTSSTGRDLFTPQELLKMKEGEGLYFLTRENVYKTHLEYAYAFPIYKWVQKHLTTNVHLPRIAQEPEFFVPDTQDFPFAYESLAKGVLLDEFVYEILSNYSPKQISDNANEQPEGVPEVVDVTDEIDTPINMPGFTETSYEYFTDDDMEN